MSQQQRSVLSQQKTSVLFQHKTSVLSQQKTSVLSQQETSASFKKPLGLSLSLGSRKEISIWTWAHLSVTKSVSLNLRIAAESPYLVYPCSGDFPVSVCYFNLQFGGYSSEAKS